MPLLCFDFGGSAVKYALVDQNANLSCEGKFPTPHDSFESLSTALGQVVDQFKDQVAGIAISLPGRIDSKSGYCYSGGYLNYNAQRAVGPQLQERFGLPVALENDAKAACRAEMWQGALKGVQNGAVLVLGTGLGGGIVVDHKLLAGPTGAAGELSFAAANVYEHHRNVESLASGIVSSSGLLALAARAYGLDYCMDMSKGYSFPMDGVEFFKRVAAWEEPALKALKQFGQATGRFMSILCAVLDCQKIAIGGGISIQPALIEACRQGLHDYFTVDYPFPPESMALTEPEVCACKFFNGANLIGAAHCFQQYHPEITFA